MERRKKLQVLDDRIFQKRQSLAYSLSIPSQQIKNGILAGNIPLKRQSPNSLCWANYLVCKYFFLFQTHVFSFFLFEHAHQMVPGQLHCYLLPQGGDRVLPLQLKRGVCRPVALHQLSEQTHCSWGINACYRSCSCSASSLCPIQGLTALCFPR